MKKKQKIGSLTYGGGTAIVYHDSTDKVNPYRLYIETFYRDDNHDYPTKHRKLVAKYTNLTNVVSAIHNSVSIYERMGWT